MDSDVSGSKQIELPSLNDFKVTSVKVFMNPEQHLQVKFSDPLDKNQDVRGFVSLTNKNTSKYRFEIDGNTLKMFPSVRLRDEHEVTIEKGIKNSLNYKLKDRFTQMVSFLEVKPNLKVESDGVILPSTDGLVLPFQAVNLKAVDVEVIKIYENNIHQFFQNNFSYDSESRLTRVGRKILSKTVNLTTDTETDFGQWNTFTLDLSKLISEEPGAIYKVKFKYNKSYSLYPCSSESAEEEEELATSEDMWYDESDYEESYWEFWENDNYYYGDYDYSERDNPCHDMYYRNKQVNKTILASNIGLIAKLGKDKKMFLTTSDLRTAKPLSGVKVELFDYQNQLIKSSTTDGNGSVFVDLERKPFLAVASKGKERAYLKLNDGNALSTSHFNVGGATVQNGIKGFIYGERGVWRPGDSIFLNFILEDKNYQLPKNQPVKLEFYNPKGQLVDKIIQPKSDNSFHHFLLKTSQEDITGNYRVNIKVGGVSFAKALKIETIKPNKLKVNLDFEDEILSSGESTGNLEVKWLHGAKARGLKARINVSLSPSSKGFEDYTTFNFKDPVKVFSSDEQTIFDGRVDDEGKATIPFDLQVSSNAPGFLKAKFDTKVFEESGDFSVAQQSMTYSPYSSYVGILPFSKKRRDILLTDKDHSTEIVTVDKDGNPIDVKDLEVEVYKLRWRWWWQSSSDNSGTYIRNNSQTLISTSKVSTKNGKGTIKVNVKYPDWGRYLVRVTNPESNHSTGTIVYLDWPGWATRTDRKNPGGASVLSFSTDKDVYKVGETAKITIPSNGNNRALVTIENGSKVLDASWVSGMGSEISYDLKITPDMAPNAYVCVSMVQPHKHENSLPIRTYGVMPITVEDPNTHLSPVLTMADELQPETTAEISVKEKDGKAMTYTLAIVDEGLLDLTRYRTPNPHASFYAREALGVTTWDFYDLVLGAYGGQLERVLSLGGDGEGGSDGDKNEVNRFKPMVRFIGPFDLKANGSKTHKIDIPNYIGSVKTMVIAGKNGAYGNTEKVTPVKKPLMVLATLPRVLGPEEKVKLPVTVFAMDDKIKNVNVKVTANDMFNDNYVNTKSISFSEEGDQVVNFELDVLDKIGKGTVKVEVSGAGETAYYDIELEVRNPNPPITQFYEKALEDGAEWNETLYLVGVQGTNEVTLELSSMPAIDLQRRLRYLLKYPHGCGEQTTSKAFPQLFLEDVMELTEAEKERANQNVLAAIDRLIGFQNSNGGFSLWPSGRSRDYVSSYIGHFLLEAEKKGYAIPGSVKSNWISYQQGQASSFTVGNMGEEKFVNSSYYDFAQAYRLYTLALANAADIGAMNRLKANGKLNNAASWRLAAAYSLAGYDDIAKQITQGLEITVVQDNGSYYHYGSKCRDLAIILESMVTMGDGDKAFGIMKDVAKLLSGERWLSTQSTAYGLMASSKFINQYSAANSGIHYSCDLNGKEIGSKNTAAKYLRLKVDPKQINSSGSFTVKNLGEGVLFARLVSSGIPSTGQEQAASSGLTLNVTYEDMDGNKIDVTEIQQGTEFVAAVTVKNLTPNIAIRDIALTQIFPSGWEIYNARMGQTAAVASDAFEYQDIRDDRVSTYFELNRYRNNNSSKTFRVVLNAAYLGRYYLPAVQAEAMYNNEVSANTSGQWINVIRPE